jgi:hypothetical protein
METDTNQTCQNSPTVPPEDVGQVTTIVSNPPNKTLPIIDGETGRPLQTEKPEYNPLSDTSLSVLSIKWAIKDLRAATIHLGIDYLEDKRREIQDRDERLAYWKAIMDLRDFHIAIMNEDLL